ncbi:DUF2231 domain-containing protein [Modicisalibacter tunisiensis]|uniref:DUF2231 domain-containing protein n=1 Tax=Modicisalibacter tunisiensis TaxID=390637 RepID=A0ABS7WXM0_9GAMM|nr:DUF2231 domain-containing protein [Modicisalibacter tunisiensis]MBZ9539514.1 DUF2231 domain-containing protein [Modicisalibacter tunisiensis]MBZ9567090.1 DUF2231 domain-containing protein [Modicisalibacter tunisiensis]
MSMAHIHPMLVHFPIVLWLLAVACQCLVVLRGETFERRRSWQKASLWLLVLGTLGGLVAAGFGDAAFDIAREKGFPAAPIESHEELAMTTLTVFGLLTLVQAVVYWRRIALNRALSWVMPVAGLAGVVLMLMTADHGGDLVYEIGVNVAAAHP